MCCAAMEGTVESTVRARRVCCASRCGGAAGRPQKRTAPQCCSHGPPRRSPPTSATALTTTASCVSAARRSHSRGRSWPCRGQTPRCTVTARTRGRSATSRWLPASRRAAAAATPRAGTAASRTGGCNPACWKLLPPHAPSLQPHASQAALLSRCALLVPPATPATASFPEQSCHFGHRIGEVVSSKSGFAWVDPGNSRTPGFAATVQGSTLTLSLRPRLAGGFLSVAYECG